MAQLHNQLNLKSNDGNSKLTINNNTLVADLPVNLAPADSTCIVNGSLKLQRSAGVQYNAANRLAQMCQDVSTGKSNFISTVLAAEASWNEEVVKVLDSFSSIASLKDVLVGSSDAKHENWAQYKDENFETIVTVDSVTNFSTSNGTDLTSGDLTKQTVVKASDAKGNTAYFINILKTSTLGQKIQNHCNNIMSKMSEVRSALPDQDQLKGQFTHIAIEVGHKVGYAKFKDANSVDVHALVSFSVAGALQSYKILAADEGEKLNTEHEYKVTAVNDAESTIEVQRGSDDVISLSIQAQTSYGGGTDKGITQHLLDVANARAEVTTIVNDHDNTYPGAAGATASYESLNDALAMFAKDSDDVYTLASATAQATNNKATAAEKAIITEKGPEYIAELLSNRETAAQAMDNYVADKLPKLDEALVTKISQAVDTINQENSLVTAAVSTFNGAIDQLEEDFEDLRALVLAEKDKVDALRAQCEYCLSNVKETFGLSDDVLAMSELENIARTDISAVTLDAIENIAAAQESSLKRTSSAGGWSSIVVE